MLALHTPGHASDHLCFARPASTGEKVLFSADHVMSWSTSIVSPPGGNMRDYFASLNLLLRRDDDIYLAGHGPLLREPRSLVRAMLAHRMLREQAIAQARGQVAFVANATAVLLERVNTMDGEVSALVESLRAGANRLAADLAAVETNMGELYDAASGQGAGVVHAVSPELPAQASIPAPPSPSAPSAIATAPGSPVPSPTAKTTPPLSPPETTEADVHADPEAPASTDSAQAAAVAENGDLDGARLVALNMALNGEPREDADRYLAENYQLADRAKLIDEVYAAIEG